MLRYDVYKEELLDPFLGVRVMVMDAYFYKGLRDRLYETFQSGAARILYEMGLGYGLIMGRIIDEQGKGRIDLYREFLQRGKYHGMAHFQVPTLEAIISELRGEIVVRARNSFFAETVGQTGHAECNIFAGYIAGAARVVLNKDYDCVEEKCVSKKDDYCEFRLKQRK